MELFSEVYGCYYEVVAAVLRAAPLDRRQIEALVSQRGYGESTLQLIPKLLGEGAWPLLTARDGRYDSRLRTSPTLPLTLLEASWLKALLADALAGLVTGIWGDLASLTVLSAWLGLIGYALQLYFDFSGYSDMAIGLGRMLGFRFPENFRYPYLCSSISDFWRRWHISLGSWFKEYLYFPLGGSRTGTLRTLRNLLLVWLATGLWHGASWNYVLWGLYFGVLICLEKLLAPRFRAHPRKGLLAGLYRPVYLLLAVLGWVLFRAEDLPAAGRYFACLFGGAAGASAQARLYLHDFWPVLLLGAVGATPLCAKLAGRLGAKLQPGVRAAVQAVLVLALLACSTVWLLNGSFQSFVYFQF